MATLKEISQRTGYSPATISRILSGDPHLSVTPEARRKVLEEAGRLNYSQTKSRRGRTPKGVLRVGIAEMLSPVQQLDDPYYLYLSGFVRQRCLDKRYTAVPLENRGSEFVVSTGGEKLDGIIAIGLFEPDQIRSLSTLSPNLVFVDSSPRESEHDSVVLNYTLGISLALEHLAKMGHRKIGFIGPEWKYDDLRQRALETRRKLFVEQMAQRGALHEEWLLECPMQTDEAAQAVEQFLTRGGERPTAFVAANEEVAIGAVRALRELNISVPEQMSVVSFNNTPRSALVDPPLTSISAHVEQMATTALDLLRSRVPLPGREAERTLPLKVVVPPTIIERKSTTFAPEFVQDYEESKNFKNGLNFY